VYKNGELFFMIFKRIPRPLKYAPKGILAVDVNEKEIVFGNGVIEEGDHRRQSAPLQEAGRKATAEVLLQQVQRMAKEVSCKSMR